jgi:malate/lactate dehydrogenase
MKVGIIGGAGGVGSAIAFYLATRDVVEEIAVIDVRENLAKSHAMDIGQAACELSSTVITSGDLTALSGCDVAVLAASAAQHALLESNLKILQAVAGPIARYCPAATVITASNPVDILSTVLCGLTGMKARQFVGFSRNDSMRFRLAIARLLKTPVNEVQAMVLGEHGPAMVPLFSAVFVRGEKVELTAEQQAEVGNYLKNWLVTYAALKSGRTNAWTTAVGVAHMIAAIATNSGERLSASAILDGQYGISGISIGVPVVLGRGGIERIVELPLSSEELAALKAAAGKISDVLKTCTGFKSQTAG